METTEEMFHSLITYMPYKDGDEKWIWKQSELFLRLAFGNSLSVPRIVGPHVLGNAAVPFYLW